MRVMLFTTINLSFLLSGCLASLPKQPAHYECTYMPGFSKFRCTEFPSGKRVKFPLDSVSMNGAQCLPINDKHKSYQAMANWVEDVKEVARQRCN